MAKRFTFGNVILIYQSRETSHRLLVDLVPTDTSPRPSVLTDVSPWVPLDRVISYEWDGRFFIAQGFTENLPHVFQLVPSKETKLDMILPGDDP